MDREADWELSKIVARRPLFARLEALHVLEGVEVKHGLASPFHALASHSFRARTLS